MEETKEGRIPVVNPISGDVIDSIIDATKDDVENAVKIAKKGYEIWSSVAVGGRTRIFRVSADRIDDNKEMFARCLSEETGKTLREAREEIASAVRYLRNYADVARHIYGNVMPSEDLCYTKVYPLGIVACITPFNYAVDLAFSKISAGLSMGNAIIVKPSCEAPLTVMKLVKTMCECGVPEEALQVITGRGSCVGSMLATHPDIQAISLTGSTNAGINVMRRSADSLKRIILELGGNDPFIVFEDADLKLAVREALLGRIKNAGQTCIAPKRFFVHESVEKEFIEILADQCKRVRIGNPFDENTDMGSLISKDAAKTVKEQVDKTVSQGARLVCGGGNIEPPYFDITILEDVGMDMDIAVDMEVFGPVFPIISFKTEDEVIKMANMTKYGLQAGVMTENIGRAMRVSHNLDCGGVVINGSGNYTEPHQAFGGWKMSGLGREGLSVSPMEYAQIKTIMFKRPYR